jgi:hypothetical protein
MSSRIKIFFSINVLILLISVITACSKVDDGESEVKKIPGFTCDSGMKAVNRDTSDFLSIQENIPYSEARKYIISQGWLPIPFSKISCDAGIGADETRKQYPEVADCAGTGINPCIFEFIKNGDLLVVYTIHESPIYVRNFKVSSAELSASIAREIENAKIDVRPNEDNRLTNALKNEMNVSDNGQKFYDIGSCAGFASLVFKEEVYKNDSEKKLLIANKMVQLKNTVNLLSINEYAGFITKQQCGDISNQSNEIFNQCVATNLSNGIKGWVQGLAASRNLIANGQLSYDEVFDQFNLYCAQFLEVPSETVNTNNSTRADIKIPAQQAGGCSAYHEYWSLLSKSSQSPRDAQFSERVARTLDSKWANDASYTDYKARGISILNQAMQNNDHSLVKSFAGFCAEIGLPIGQNTRN